MAFQKWKGSNKEKKCLFGSSDVTPKRHQNTLSQISREQKEILPYFFFVLFYFSGTPAEKKLFILWLRIIVLVK